MQISKNCFVVLGLSTISPWAVNAGFIVGSEKTLVIDSGGNWLGAQTIYGYAKLANPKNQIILLNTEPHFDHTGGNSFFSEKGIDIYGHYLIHRELNQMPLLEEELTNTICNNVRRNANEGRIFYQNTEIVNPNIKIEKETEIDLGDICAKIIFTHGHTNKNISVFVEQEQVLFSGDTVIQGYIPNLEEGSEAEWKSWIKSLEKIQSLNVKLIIPGHGKIITENDIDSEINRMKLVINSAIETGTAPTKC